MKYEEIVEKINKKENIRTSEVSQSQFFALIRDGHIKYIKINSNTYEVNLLPCANSSVYYNVSASFNDKDESGTATDGFHRIEDMIYSATHLRTNYYISINGQIYQFIPEIMESENE